MHRRRHATSTPTPRRVAALVGCLLAGLATSVSATLPAGRVLAQVANPPCASSARSGTPYVPGLNCRQITVGGTARNYLVRVPPSMVLPTTSKVVFVLHGTNGSGAEFAARASTGWSDLQDERGFVVVYPSATTLCLLRPGVRDEHPRHECDDPTLGHWEVRFNAFPAMGLVDADQTPAGHRGVWPVDDVAFFDAIRADLAASGVTPARPGLYVSGFSSGGCMTAMLAFERSSDIDAASIVAGCGGDPAAIATPPTRYIPISYRIGTHDPVVSGVAQEPEEQPFSTAGYLAGLGAKTIVPIVTRAGLDPTVVSSAYTQGLGSRTLGQGPAGARYLLMTFRRPAAGAVATSVVNVILTKQETSDGAHTYNGLDITAAQEAWGFFTASTRP